MVEAADLGEGDNLASMRQLDLPRHGAVHVQGAVSAEGMIVMEIPGERTLEMPFSENEHMVEAFAPDAPDDPFNIRGLPWAPRGDYDLLDAHVLDPSPEKRAIDPVPIPEHVSRRFIPGKRFKNLPRGPVLAGVLRHVEMDHPAPFMSEQDQHEQQLEFHRGHDEEVNRNKIAHMILQEAPPCLSRRLPVTNHVLLNRRLGHVDADLSQFPHDPWRTPERVGTRHLADQILDLLGDRRPARPAGLAELDPVLPELPASPGKDRRRLDDQKGIPPVRQEPGNPAPEDPIRWRDPWPLHGSLQHGNLMTEDGDLDLHGIPRTEEAGNEADQCNKDGFHVPNHALASAFHGEKHPGGAVPNCQ